MAYGDLGLQPDQFYDLTLAQFLYMIAGHERRFVNQWHQTRLMLSAWTGQDPRSIMLLPGDIERFEAVKDKNKLAQMWRKKDWIS